MASLRKTELGDLDAVFGLYRNVAGRPGGLARLETEIDKDFVRRFLRRAIDSGVAFVAVSDDGDIDGEIHAVSPGIFCFSHVLTDLTIAVHPAAQSRGLGRQLFETFMREIMESRPDIDRVELIARESNARALLFYESLGFVREGEFRRRIRNVDGSLESDIPMAWIRHA
ncbi:MAG: GNAT family N-acetyltransferase [Woeseiaceae bacterium]|nr:GNAT family N-acetyltransferase [Woeseiaceae bacterium]